jgi:hypothetical protein
VGRTARVNQTPRLHQDGVGLTLTLDLEIDPAEQYDVAAQHPDVVNRLKAIFDRRR